MRRNRMLVFDPKRNRILNAAWGILLILALTPLGITPSYGSAGPQNGDPFSNGTFFPSEGTFQAIIRGKNLTGVATFSTIGFDDTSTSGGGIYSVFFDGVTYVGNVNSSIDVHSGKIAATFEASVPRIGVGSGSSVVDSQFGVISETFEQGGTTTNFTSGGTTTDFQSGGTTTESTSGRTTTTTVVFEMPPGTIISETTTTVVTPGVTTSNTTPDVTTSDTTPDVTTSDTTPDTFTQESGLINTIANFDFIDVLYSAGAFVANLRNSYPNQSFDGKGTFSFSELDTSSGIPQVVTTTVKIKVDGVRVADTIQSFTPVDVQVPAVLVTFEIQTGAAGG